jgi:O-antigen/teichoic acid export membrane protein
VKNKLLKNGIYNSIGGILKIIVGLLTIPIIIRLIGTEEYGLWSLTSSIVSIVLLAEAGLSTATTVFASEDLKRKDTKGLLSTLTSTTISVLVLSTAAAVLVATQAEHIINNFGGLNSLSKERALISLQISSVVVWSKLFQQLLVGIQQAYERYDTVNIINTGFSILNGLFLICIATWHGKVAELMIGQSIVSMISLAVHMYIVIVLFKEKKLAFRLVFNLEKMMRIIKYSSLLWITTLGSILFSRVDRLVVGNLLGIQFLGIYSAITDITAQINSFSALAVQPIISFVTESKISDKNEIIKIREQVIRSLIVNTVVSLVMGSVLICGAPWILQKVLNIYSLDATNIASFKIATIIYSLYSINAVGFYILLGANKTFISSIISLFVGAATLTMIFAGCHYGLTGAIIGNAGFLGVYLFTFAAMRILDIESMFWIKKIWISIFLFTSISLMNVCSIIDHNLTIILLLIYCAYSMRYMILTLKSPWMSEDSN